MNITLTPKAKERLHLELERGSHMRIDITHSGCCGYALTILPSLGKPDDISIDVDGLSLAVAKDVNEFIRNIKIDYKRRGIRKGFYIQPA